MATNPIRRDSTLSVKHWVLWRQWRKLRRTGSVAFCALGYRLLIGLMLWVIIGLLSFAINQFCPYFEIEQAKTVVLAAQAILLRRYSTF